MGWLILLAVLAVIVGLMIWRSPRRRGSRETGQMRDIRTNPNQSNWYSGGQ